MRHPEGRRTGDGGKGKANHGSRRQTGSGRSFELSSASSPAFWRRVSFCPGACSRLPDRIRIRLPSRRCSGTGFRHRERTGEAWPSFPRGPWPSSWRSCLLGGGIIYHLAAAGLIALGTVDARWRSHGYRPEARNIGCDRRWFFRWPGLLADLPGEAPDSGVRKSLTLGIRIRSRRLPGPCGPLRNARRRMWLRISAIEARSTAASSPKPIPSRMSGMPSQRQHEIGKRKQWRWSAPCAASRDRRRNNR